MAQCGLKYLFIGLTVFVVLAFLIAFFLTSSFGYKYNTVCPNSGTPLGSAGKFSGY